MSAYRDQLQKFLAMYEEETGGVEAVSARDVAAWAYSKGMWQPRPRDVIDQLADDLAKAWREEYRTDRYGRHYRAKHAVKVVQGKNQLTLWADIDSDTTPRSHMERAFAQRRQQVVGDCLQLKTDVDVYNDLRNKGEPIQVVLDFTEDVAELQQRYRMDDDAA